MSGSLILSNVVRVAGNVLLLFAAYLFAKGHNSPGGGFIAGLLTAAAIVLRHLAFGRDPERERATGSVTAIGVGLAIALATASASVLLGYPFFSQTFTHVHLPVVGDIELATAALFDLGVYVVVVGNVVTVIRAMTDPA